MLRGRDRGRTSSPRSHRQGDRNAGTHPRRRRQSGKPAEPTHQRAICRRGSSAHSGPPADQIADCQAGPRPIPTTRAPGGRACPAPRPTVHALPAPQSPFALLQATTGELSMGPPIASSSTHEGERTRTQLPRAHTAHNGAGAHRREAGRARTPPGSRVQLYIPRQQQKIPGVIVWDYTPGTQKPASLQEKTRPPSWLPVELPRVGP